MKKLSLWLAMIVLSAGQSICAQSPGQVTAQPGNLTGMLYASSFGQWQVPQGNQGQFSWSNSTFCNANANGFYLNPVFAVGTPIFIKDQVVANSEIVTPSAVTIGGFGCSITVSPANKHNTFTLNSATAGLQEAINFAKGLPYQVILTPDWTRLGGATGMILAAKGSAAVAISDQRSPCIIAYLWSGSAYVAQPSSCGGGSGSSVVLQVNGTSTGVSQTVQNLNSTTPAAQSGFEACQWQNDGAGNDTCQLMPANFGNFVTPPIGGNYVILYPTTEEAHISSAGGCTATVSNGAGQIVRTNVSHGDATGCTVTQSGYSLPGSISPSSVTNIYGAFVANRYVSQGIPGSSMDMYCTSGSQSGAVFFGPPGYPFAAFPMMTVVTAPITGPPSAFNYSTAYCTFGDADSFDFDPNNPYPTVTDNVAQSVLIVYSPQAPAPPPLPTDIINVTNPITYTPQTNTIGFLAPYDWAADTGIVNAYLVSVPIFGSPGIGTEIKFSPLNSNTTTNPTLNLNGSGPATIVKLSGGTAVGLASGDISATGCATGPCIADVILDTQNLWELQNPATGGGGATFQVNGTPLISTTPAVNFVNDTNVTITNPSGGNIHIASTGGGGGGALVKLGQIVATGSSSTSETFSGISGSYTDLILSISGRQHGGGSGYIYLQVNGDTGADYNWSASFNNGGSFYGANETSVPSARFGFLGYDPIAAGLTGSVQCTIHNYTNTVFADKTGECTFSMIPSVNYGSGVSSFSWIPSSSAAITSLTVTTGNDDVGFFAGTVFTLYGRQ